MKKYLIITAFLLAIVVPLNQSCTDLEETVFTELTEDQFPQTPEQIIALVGAAYTSLYNFGGHNSFVSLNHVSGDDVMIPQRGSDWFDGGQWLRVHRHEYNANEESVNNGWNTLYGGIANCNRIIATLDELVAAGAVEAATAAAFDAELKVLRAMFYYWLLDLYGNVPIVTGFADAPANPPTASRVEVYNFVESELVTNGALLPKTKSLETYGRMTYYVAQALLAKLYLNAEVYTGTPQWSKCAAACDEVINSGLYSLEGNYFANFNAENGGSGETIFAIPYDRDDAQGFVLPAMTMHYSSQETFNLTFQPWNGYCSLQEFYNSYENGDVRKGVPGDQSVRSNFLAGDQFKSNGDRLTDSQDDGDPNGLPITFTPEINEHFPNCFRQAGARVGKFEYASGATQNLDNDFPVLRYADILMTKAEALWRDPSAGMGDPLAMVNMIRTRAGVAPFTMLTADDLLAERGRELFYENWRRGDLIRFGKFNDAWDFKPASDPQKNIFPIPQNQISANPNLVQNPGY